MLISVRFPKIYLKTYFFVHKNHMYVYLYKVLVFTISQFNKCSLYLRRNAFDFQRPVMKTKKKYTIFNHHRYFRWFDLLISTQTVTHKCFCISFSKQSRCANYLRRTRTITTYLYTCHNLICSDKSFIFVYRVWN